MTKFSFLTVALVGLTLLSCSKDDGVNGDVDSAPGEDAKISLSFNNINTRVISGAVTDVADQVINDASVFIFRASGAKDVPMIYLAGFESDIIQELASTTAAKRVYVIANLGNEAAHTAMFAGVTNEAVLNALIKDRMDDLNNGAISEITATDVLMTGFGDVDAFTANGSALESAVDINLAFPLAKIQLIVKDNRLNNILPADVNADGKIAIVDNKVVLINAGRSIKFFTADAGLDQASQFAFYTGKAGVDPADGFKAYFSDDATSSKAQWFTGNDNTENSATNSVVTHHFYTAANNAVNSPTILTIESTKTTMAEGATVTSTVYYPIQFTMLDAQNTLLPGKSYTVTLTLTGDVSTGGGGGVIDPEVPVVPGTIHATITVASWEPVSIDKEI